MDENDRLAERFEEHRAHLRAVGYRMLGSVAEADDAVQESWLRLSRSDAEEIGNLRGWLTTVVSRIALNMLRSRTVRREEPLDAGGPEPVVSMLDPEEEALLGDSVGLALLVVLDTLAPAERLAFVLHDMFAVPFDDIAPIVDRSPAATRQLASRARRRVQGGASATVDTDLTRRREIVDAFLAASRGGDFETLLTLLDPDVVLRADAVTVQSGAESEVRGAKAVAQTFSGRARAAQLALLNGVTGAVWRVGGAPRVVFAFTITDGRISGIELLSDPKTLGRIDVIPAP